MKPSFFFPLQLYKPTARSRGQNTPHSLDSLSLSISTHSKRASTRNRNTDGCSCHCCVLRESIPSSSYYKCAALIPLSDPLFPCRSALRTSLHHLFSLTFSRKDMDWASSHEFDNIKAEKAKAMRRDQRTRKLTTIAHALELLLALLLLSWYSSGLSAAAGAFLRRLAGLLAKPIVVFLISNGIIVAIVYLAGKNDDRPHRQEPHHIDQEYLSARRAYGGGGSTGTAAAPDKQIVPYEAPPPHEKIITEVPLPVPESDHPPLTADPAVEKGPGEEHVVRLAPAAAEKRYRRTRSEVTEEGGPRAELCRSATDNGRPKPLRGEERLSSVEDLTNEEFNLTVEKYIAATKLFLREEEIMAKDAVPRFHSVAVN